ncbi:MAG: hypothetical protein IPO04_18790 [Cytophagaceae bacterium]|nr:hypothetical protein [Cytophagaceae bacterium]
MRAIWFIFFFWVSVNAMGQTKVYTDDIRHFYEAFDSVNLQTDKALQLKTVQTLYVDRASQGLKDFMALGGGNTQRWLNYMIYNKKVFTGNPAQSRKYLRPDTRNTVPPEPGQSGLSRF